jgi:hypothetical protein
LKEDRVGDIGNDRFGELGADVDQGHELSVESIAFRSNFGEEGSELANPLNVVLSFFGPVRFL